MAPLRLGDPCPALHPARRPPMQSTRCSIGRPPPGLGRCAALRPTIKATKRCVVVAVQQPRRKDNTAALRSEAEAPFRAVRLVLYGAFVGSATIGFLVSISKLIGSLGGARGAQPLPEVLQNLAIDAIAIGGFGFLFRGDWQARKRQLTRILREEALSDLTVELVGGRLIRVGDLRGSARVVVVAGDAGQVTSAMQAAEAYKEELCRRGVFVVAVPIYGDGAGDARGTSSPSKDDVRWRGQAVRLEEWKGWFTDQLESTSGVSSANGLYVGLRMDGRVRASGAGAPPWAAFVAQLPPVEGLFKGFLDGLDGPV
ncbi:unnamed protein product [Ostreobium quekettii]|uniref:Uncharacterized protein n=1 Tax=Ostreobium quekettii TaxID=121088 RepID=A0A8S1J0X1_9CHLO|nr:unnamed protein product [Ostreobium quekettii]|eukprot:evm.model.scf_3207.1 EVM.evm.TU.scf_3207.1   scf_3207:243-10289(+)